ncbi:MAG: hypothetical protein C5B60_02790 [Chloroflexi bacterium]|nr:MAG: hypothetical protein C5B60_02790 [Chloroflexota bacterium]
MASHPLRARKRRPFAVTILGFLVFLSALLDLGVVILAIFAIPAGQIRFVAPRLTQADQLSEVPAIGILLALSILQILLARGLFGFRAWAYGGVVLLESVNVAFGVFSLINQQPEEQTLLTLALPVLILVYLLFDHNVHQAFRR